MYTISFGRTRFIGLPFNHSRSYFASMVNNPYLKIKKTLDGTRKEYFCLRNLNDERLLELPYSIRILLEAAVRNCDEYSTTSEHVEKILNWATNSTANTEIPFIPARVLLQDFTFV